MIKPTFAEEASDQRSSPLITHFATYLPLYQPHEKVLRLDEPIATYRPVLGWAGKDDVEPPYQVRDQLTEFHQSNVLADASAGAAAELRRTGAWFSIVDNTEM